MLLPEGVELFRRAADPVKADVIFPHHRLIMQIAVLGVGVEHVHLKTASVELAVEDQLIQHSPAHPAEAQKHRVKILLRLSVRRR